MLYRLGLSWLGWLGIDQAIFFNLLTRFWQTGAGIATLFFIVRSLSKQQQGVYYTFGSVLALQVFFELGLTFIVQQFASHEKARLEWTPLGNLEGDSHAKARLASLLRLAGKWYAVAAGALLVVVAPAGLLFFESQAGNLVGVAYRLPWIILVICTAGSLLTSPVFAIIEGVGKIRDVARFRALQEIVSTLLLWAALHFRWGLFAACIFQGSRMVCGALWLVLRQKSFLLELLRLRSAHSGIHWGREIWPFQWRIALSWISGYFVMQLFNPVLFAFKGPVTAGQMGMSLAVVGGLTNSMLTWISTKAPAMGTLVARKEYRQLDQLFFTSLRRSLLFYTVGSVAVWFGVLYLNRIGNPLSQRLLTPPQLALLLGASLASLAVSSLAIYLRAHKQEPFLMLSMITGALTGVSTLCLVWWFGVTAMLAGYFFVMLLVGLGWGSFIFLRKRRLWHQTSYQL